MLLDEHFQVLRVTADTTDRPGHCSTVVRRREREGGSEENCTKVKRSGGTGGVFSVL